MGKDMMGGAEWRSEWELIKCTYAAFDDAAAEVEMGAGMIRTTNYDDRFI